MRWNQNWRRNVLRLFDYWNFFCLSFLSFSFLFAVVIDLLLGLLSVKKTHKEASSRRAIFTMDQPGVVAGNFFCVFHSTFLAFLCIILSRPFGQSPWSEHHWKDVFLLQKLSIDDANFRQKGWRQKWKKGWGSSRPVMDSTGVNGLTNCKPK